ncbi:LysM peptidoglycan-binding domain-containing protein [Paenibacillus wynnii]|uniref:LysM domain-containing protein n=1 Tax=Paenibacillus wynnii TaxID=268407 RepID=A0A098MET7_9BACL|nr:LysM peptidoglycan-binding domain-containing protein [Paenibacillus wynnii]KGE21075.1 hypothetical protein PWYN_02670 [Paenibacillus wynnii]
MEEYGIYLSFNNLMDLFRLPVNPETLEIKESGNSKSYDIIDFGEINTISAPKLMEITLDSIFPAQNYPFVLVSDTSLMTPFEYVKIIKKWMESKKPIRFVFSGIASPKEQNPKNSVALNMAASIENFSWKLSAGNSGDIEYSLTLKKYVFYQAIAVKVDKGEVKAETKRPNDKAIPATYKLKAGDTLWSVAKKVLGDGSKYKVIQKLNGISDSQLTKLPVGKVIKLPQGG